MKSVASNDVHILGVGMSPFGRHIDSSLNALTEKAVSLALCDARLAPSDIGAVFFGSAIAGAITGQEMIPGQVAMAPLGLTGIPVFNIENACASSATAFFLACDYLSLHGGKPVLVVGAEKMTHPDKERTANALRGALDVNADVRGSSSSAPLMDIYAHEALEYLEMSDATVEDFALVARKNHLHANLNPLAHYGGDFSIEAILASRVIAPPLTLLMCSPISDGAAAAVVGPSGFHGRSRVPSVRVLSCALRSGEPAGSERRCVELAALEAYRQASIEPGEIDLAEVHDASAAAEIEIYEQLGLAERGQGSELIRARSTELGGRIPVNVSGGLLGRGHPLGATGLAQIYELVNQLLGRCGNRQVDAPTVALAHCNGGWLGHDHAVTCISVLARSE